MSDENKNSDPQLEDDTIELINQWDDLDIDPSILRSIYAYGFEKPSPIQRRGIKPLVDGRDVIGQAQSGTGKTGTFSIGVLSRIDLKKNDTQALIMSPTHELTRQITKVIKSLSEMMDGIRIKTIIGGSSIDEDVTFMRDKKPHIIVGCPGRVYDMIRRRHINASTIKMVVLDEADEMLSQGFKDQIYNIFQHLNKDVQIALFSATLPPNITALADQFMRNPVKIKVAAEQLTLEGIKQYFVAVQDDHQKYVTLKDLYGTFSSAQTIIYCNSVKRVIELYEAMVEDGFPVCCIHSSMDHDARKNALSDFSSGTARFLISSNVTARGIDIQQVSLVINFDLPRDVHTYIHRIGRSGRWGRKGTGINFITRRDVQQIKEIEEYYHCQIDELPVNLVINS
jgi:translation initiation factor 4A